MTVELISRQEGQTITSGNEFNITEGLGGVSIQQGSGVSPKVRMDDDGVKIFSASGRVIAKLGEDGFSYFNNNGGKVATVGADGFNWFDKNGTLRATIGSDADDGRVRMLIFDERGMPTIIIGQDPADGEPIIAAVPTGEDVEGELTS